MASPPHLLYDRWSKLNTKSITEWLSCCFQPVHDWFVTPLKIIPPCEKGCLSTFRRLYSICCQFLCNCLHDNFKNYRYLSFSATGFCRRRSKIKNGAFEPGRAAANANPSNPFLVNSFECPFVFCRPCLSLHRRCCLLPPSVKQYFPVESQRSVTVFFRPINVTMQSSGVAPFARATQKV